MVACLGQPDVGGEIGIGSTFELAPQDVIFVVFPFGSNGWFKYGSEESFSVVSVDAETGDVSVVDEGGAPFVLPGGTRAQLEERLAELTSFSAIQVYRPGLGPPGPIVTAKALGMPSGYSEIPVGAWGELEIGDHVLVGQASNVRTLLRVEDDDPELLIARVVGTESWTTEAGELWYFQAESQILSPDAAFRRSAPAAGVLLPAAGVVLAASVAAFLVFS